MSLSTTPALSVLQKQRSGDVKTLKPKYRVSYFGSFTDRPSDPLVTPYIKRQTIMIINLIGTSENSIINLNKTLKTLPGVHAVFHKC